VPCANRLCEKIAQRDLLLYFFVGTGQYKGTYDKTLYSPRYKGVSLAGPLIAENPCKRTHLYSTSIVRGSAFSLVLLKTDVLYVESGALTRALPHRVLPVVRYYYPLQYTS